MPVNTGRIAHQSLSNSQLVVGASWPEAQHLPEPLRHPDASVVLLYPGPDAKDISSIPTSPAPTIVVLDGTWAQARTMFRDSPPLQALPKYAFHPPHPSEYRIRKEPKRQYVSTIEALAHVLSVIEQDPALPERLLAPFRAMVDWQVGCVTGRHEPRRRVRQRRARRVPLVPPEVRQRLSSVVCVSAEANAWPKQSTHDYPREMVHLVASRPHDGTRFEAIVAPSFPVAPETIRRTGLDDMTLRAGMSKLRFRAEWKAFLRPDDVICSWGYYPIHLLREIEAFDSRRHVDLRAVVKFWTKKRWMSLQHAYDTIVMRAGASVTQGHTAQQMSWLEALWLRVVQECRER